jgi:uncharacterized protein YuzE
MVDFRVTYDEIANAAYIYFGNESSRLTVARMYPCDPVEAGMINIDFDEAGRVIGIEVLAADTKLSPSLLDKAERIDPDGG